jgi:hypothetical protein
MPLYGRVIYMTLKNNFVRIRDEEDQHIWSQNPTGEYVPKIGYETSVVEGRKDN